MKTGRAYLGTTPSKTRVIRICRAISDETGRNRTLLDHKDGGKEAQSNDDRLGELLLSWIGQQGLPGSGSTCLQRAASVAVHQTQSAVAGDRGISSSQH